MEQMRKKIHSERKKDIDKDEKTRDRNNISKSCQELTYDVLCIIFKYLNGLDLNNASKVCRSWLEAANSEKRTRGPTCLMRNVKDWRYTPIGWEGVKRYSIECSQLKPSLALFFTVGHKSSLSESCHCDDLPPNCHSVSLDTHGVVINDTARGEENSDHIVCMSLPDVPNIKTSILTFNLYDWKDGDLTKLTKFTYHKQLKAAFETSSDSDSRKASCLMLFCDWDGRKIALHLLKSLGHWVPETRPCIWGGIAKNLSVCNSVNNTRVCKNSANCIAIVLSGTKMRTWSILLDVYCDTQEKVEDELRTFKDRVRLKKHSMGFMFACRIRGRDMFDENYVESTIFKQFFPEVPLVGCYGDGEFGKKMLNETSKKKPKKWYTSMSTVFMILTYD